MWFQYNWMLNHTLEKSQTMPCLLIITNSGNNALKFKIHTKCGICRRISLGILIKTRPSYIYNEIHVPSRTIFVLKFGPTGCHLWWCHLSLNINNLMYSCEKVHPLLYKIIIKSTAFRCHMETPKTHSRFIEQLISPNSSDRPELLILPPGARRVSWC